MPLREERDRARGLATTVVSTAIALFGATLVVFAVLLIVRGGWGFAFLSIVLLLAGAALALLGLFFQLVPMRLRELAQRKREYDESRLDRENPREP